MLAARRDLGASDRWIPSLFCPLNFAGRRHYFYPIITLASLCRPAEAYSVEQCPSLLLLP